MTSKEIEKITGIAVFALLLAIIGISGNGIINNYFNTTNISILQQNVTDLNNDKVNKSGDTMTGNLNFNQHKIYNISEIYNNGSFTMDMYTGTSSSHSGVGFSPELNYTYLYAGLVSSYNIIELYKNYTSFSKNINLNNNSIINCLNCAVSDSGNYSGDGTTDRFIPYKLGKNATKIDILSNSSTGLVGEIVIPGYITNLTISPGKSTNTQVWNTTGFYVNGSYNNASITYKNSTLGDQSSNTGTSLNVISYQPITAALTGNMIQIGLNIKSNAGNVMLALYSNSGSSPSTLLANTSSTVEVLGWNNLTISYPVTSGTSYWIAYQCSSTSSTIYFLNSGSFKYQTYTYGSFPTTASGLSTGTATINMGFNIENTVTTQYYWTAMG